MRVDVGRVMEVLRARHLVPDTCLALYAVGSAARGWSNRRSDLDLCLISTEPWFPPDSVEIPVPLRPSLFRRHTFHADNHVWDLTYWLDDHVEQMLTKISWAEFDQVRASSDDVLAPQEAVFLGRMAMCVPLVGEAWVARRRAEIDVSAFRSILVTRSLGAANLAIEDALGQMEIGDHDSAVLSARIAFDQTVDALLAERGEYESHIPKWRARRFRAADLRTLTFSSYWAIETMREFDHENPSKWISDVLTLCQDLALKVNI